MKEPNAELRHRKVENTNNTPKNIHLTGKEATRPRPTMRNEMPTKWQSLIVPAEIHRQTHHNANRIENRRTTVTVIDGGNIRRQAGRHTKRRNRKNISSPAAIPRTIDSDVIHRMTTISTTKRKRRRVSVHDPDLGIEDNCFFDVLLLSTTATTSNEERIKF